MQQDRYARLLTELTAEKDAAQRIARRLEVTIGRCRTLSIIIGVLAAVAGMVPLMPFPVDAWMVSALAGAATFLQVLPGTTGWRAKSQTYYEQRNIVRGLIYQVKHQVSHSAIDDDVAILAAHPRPPTPRMTKYKTDPP